MKTVSIDGKSLTMRDVVEVARHRDARVKLAPAALDQIRRSRAVVERAVAERRVIYGLTTGFGLLKNVTIPPEKTVELQENLIRSHCVGVGRPFAEEIVRAAILIRVNSLAAGYSGIRESVLDALLALINEQVYPYVPEQGSVGASGDLAPLSHLVLALMGEGECWKDGRRVPATDELRRAGITPVRLQAKEGLALNNGTAFMCAVLALAMHDVEQLKRAADVIAGMSVEALMGSEVPFHPLVQQLRPHPGQIASADNIRRLIAGSGIIASHVDCDRVQDAYSLRCIPQVHGASRDAIDYVRGVVERELNSVTDNPLVFPDENETRSAGNFHGEPLAIAADTLAIAVAEFADISERRTAKLVDPATSDGLPAFLIPKEQGGLSSGYMIAQYTAASLVSENGVLCHPASTDSIPTSANQEDHVSMGSIATRKALQVVKNVANVLAIEYLCAAQAADLRKPLTLGRGTSVAHALLRRIVPTLERDRVLYPEIEQARKLLQSPAFYDEVGKAVGSLK